MGKSLLSNPSVASPGHPLSRPGSQLSIGNKPLLAGSRTGISPCCQVPFLSLVTVVLDHFAEADSNVIFALTSLLQTVFLSQCNLSGGRLESVIIDYRYGSQCKPWPLQLFLFCGTFLKLSFIKNFMNIQYSCMVNNKERENTSWNS